MFAAQFWGSSPSPGPASGTPRASAAVPDLYLLIRKPCDAGTLRRAIEYASDANVRMKAMSVHNEFARSFPERADGPSRP